MGTAVIPKPDDVEEDARLAALRNRLVKARLDRGIGVEDAAASMGISRVQLWRIETNPNTKLTVERLLQLTDLYGIDPIAVMTDSISVAPKPVLFDWITQAVLIVEDVLAEAITRPSPQQVAAAVVAILKQESKNTVEQPGHEFDADGYRRLISALISRVDP